MLTPVISPLKLSCFWKDPSGESCSCPSTKVPPPRISWPTKMLGKTHKTRVLFSPIKMALFRACRRLLIRRMNTTVACVWSVHVRAGMFSLCVNWSEGSERVVRLARELDVAPTSGKKKEFNGRTFVDGPQPLHTNGC